MKTCSENVLNGIHYENYHPGREDKCLGYMENTLTLHESNQAFRYIMRNIGVHSDPDGLYMFFQRHPVL